MDNGQYKEEAKWNGARTYSFDKENKTNHCMSLRCLVCVEQLIYQELNSIS